MKKIILTLGAVSMMSLTACKKEESKTTGTPSTENKVSETSTSSEETPPADAPKTVNGVEVPKFSNPEAQKFANEYAAYMSEMMAASKSGDVAKIQELSAKSQEWNTKQSTYASKMTAEDAKLLSDFVTKLSQAQVK